MPDVSEFDEESFREVCLAVADDAAELRELLQRSGQPTSRTLDELGIVLDQALELRLAVVGDFKRGKSSVINAVVGEDVLPTDVLPCTSGIIELTHGTDVQYEMVRDGRPDPRSRDEFLAGAGAASAAGTLDDIAETWRVRTPRMPRGFVLVDTPGLNEDEQRVALTQAEASRCHASLLVLAADQPLSRSEQEILELLPVDSTAFLLNRGDLVRSADLERIEAHVLRRLPDERSVEPQLWIFSAVSSPEGGSSGLISADQLHNELVTFVSERSLSSRARRLVETTRSTATELRSRAADRVEALEGSASGLRSAHEQALEELDRANATSRRIVRLLEESAERIALETSEALADEWDAILDRWAATSRRWRSRHPMYDVRKLKTIAEDMADDALKELQRELEEWTTDRVDEVIVGEWEKAVEEVAADVTDFLRSLDRVAPTGARKGARSLRDLRPEGAVQGAVVRAVAGGALFMGIGAALRAVLLRQVATAIAARLAFLATPASIAAGLVLLAVQARGFKDELRRQVRNAMRRQFTKRETVKTVTNDVRKGVRRSLDADIRDVQSNLSIWIDDAEAHVAAKWSDVDNTQAELERRRLQLEEISALCTRMVGRLEATEGRTRHEAVNVSG